jgi:pimeloyl-ACP methyl ester carboxylesterase
MSQRGRTIDAGDLRLAVREWDGPGQPVILVHGLGLGSRAWDRVVPRLRTRGLRVVVYDQRGHGRSESAAAYTPAAFATDLAAVVDGLGLVRPLLVGHSLGALVALDHAAARGDCAGVVAVDGGVPATLPALDWAALEGARRSPLLRLMERAMRLAGVGTALSLAEQRAVVTAYEAKAAGLEDLYGRVACPIMLVMGARADTVPNGAAIRAALHAGVRRAQAARPDIQVEWLPCGHNVPLERPAELADLVGRFAT